jgi:ATP-dependent Clp protease ATP-binding subunit ClpC
MFERYTEHARRAIFFARYEASEFGSPYIETEHLLLGILRERTSLKITLPSSLNLEQARNHFKALSPVREKISTSVDLPLTHAAKRVLTYASEEAERLSDPHIGTQHLLLGLLREDSAASQMLHQHGLDLDQLRNDVAKSSTPGNEQTVYPLREKFAQISRRLTPEIEPATIYLLQLLDAGAEPAE